MGSNHPASETKLDHDINERYTASISEGSSTPRSFNRFSSGTMKMNYSPIMQRRTLSHAGEVGHSHCLQYTNQMQIRSLSDRPSFLKALKSTMKYAWDPISPYEDELSRRFYNEIDEDDLRYIINKTKRVEIMTRICPILRSSGNCNHDLPITQSNVFIQNDKNNNQSHNMIHSLKKPERSSL
jgi:hypothetical protein